MPTPLRSDQLHTVKVAHASLHQAARSLSDAGQEDLSQQASTLATDVYRLIDVATEPAKTRRNAAPTTSKAPQESAE